MVEVYPLQHLSSKIGRPPASVQIFWTDCPDSLDARALAPAEHTKRFLKPRTAKRLGALPCIHSHLNQVKLAQLELRGELGLLWLDCEAMSIPRNRSPALADAIASQPRWTLEQPSPST